MSTSGRAFNMGYIQSQPVVAGNGTLTLRYIGGDHCHKGKPNEAPRSTRINFYCSPSEVRVHFISFECLKNWLILTRYSILLPFNFVCFRLDNYAVSLQSARTGFSANWSEASTVTAFIKLSLFERIQMHNYPIKQKVSVYSYSLL